VYVIVKTLAPSTARPKTAKPTVAATTKAPTTAKPTTAMPTTAMPTAVPVREHHYHINTVLSVVVPYLCNNMH
jgi:hypothetical protein